MGIKLLRNLQYLGDSNALWIVKLSKIKIHNLKLYKDEDIKNSKNYIEKAIEFL